MKLISTHTQWTANAAKLFWEISCISRGPENLKMSVPFAKYHVKMTYLISSLCDFKHQWGSVETVGIQELDCILKRLDYSGSSEHLSLETKILLENSVQFSVLSRTMPYNHSCIHVFQLPCFLLIIFLTDYSFSSSHEIITLKSHCGQA